MQGPQYSTLQNRLSKDIFYSYYSLFKVHFENERVNLCMENKFKMRFYSSQWFY